MRQALLEAGQHSNRLDGRQGRAEHSEDQVSQYNHDNGLSLDGGVCTILFGWPAINGPGVALFMRLLLPPSSDAARCEGLTHADSAHTKCHATKGDGAVAA